ncbi:MAG: T9SS type A sorting domain-containing protein [Bacteroidota bacterium]
MIRKFTIILSALILATTSLSAQTVNLTFSPYGVSPRDVAKSKTDIYAYPFSGLTNVGVGTLCYFKAAITGKKFASPVFSITKKPSGSTTKIGTTKDIQNDSTQIITFTPDKAGTYVLSVTDGSYTSVLTFNAAKYVGVYNTVINGIDTKLQCKTCHSGKVGEWENTLHSSMFTRAMKATPGLSGPTDHYSKNCIGCHTTGYDADSTAVNDGFDDLPFTYPSVVTPQTYDTLVVKFPKAMLRANIQCESCHGPASGHLGTTTDERMVASWDAKVCAYCHDSGTRHFFPDQWAVSKHAIATSYPTGSGRETCVRCHSGKGFAEFVEGVSTTDPYFDASYIPITCAACHDPHSDANVNQLRTVSVSLLAPGGTTKQITNAGKGALCMNCHQSRAEANAAIAGAGTSAINLRFGPHYGAQGDMLESNNMLELGGQKLATTNHIGATVDACVRCHMYKNNVSADAQGNIIKMGNHTFSMMSPDGTDNMEACAQCHGSTFGTGFDQVKFYLNGSADFDNNGIEEGIQKEVKGMITKVMAQLATTIPGVVLSTSYGFTKDDGTWFGFPTPSSKWTKDQLSAYWNAFTAFEDKSGGIHNPKYIVTALRGAMKLLGIATAVKQDYQETVPTDYVVYQNYPNPFNPSTNIRFALPKESHVKLTVYDVTGREIVTLVNDNLNAGVHTVEWSAKDLASGMYLYRIEAGSFVKVNKMILLK